MLDSELCAAKEFRYGVLFCNELRAPNRTAYESTKSIICHFCNEQAYARSQPNKEREVFTFVFTDEDYEYARKHADKTEQVALHR